MSTETILKDKAILVVDDEPDILDSIAEQLDMCRIYRAKIMRLLCSCWLP